MPRTAAALAALLALPGAAALAEGVATPLATAPEVTIADLLPPAEEFPVRNVAIMANDTDDGLTVTLEIAPADAGTGAMPIPLLITQRGMQVRMIGKAIDTPARMGPDAQTGPEMGLPEAAECVGSAAQGNIVYCRAGAGAIVQVGGSGLSDMAQVLAITAALPFERYDAVFAQ